MQGSEGVPLGTVRVQRRFCGLRLEPDLWAAVFEELLLGPVPQTAQVAAEGRRVKGMTDIPLSQGMKEPSQFGAFAV